MGQSLVESNAPLLLPYSKLGGLTDLTVIDNKLLQPEKAFEPILVTLSGIIIEDNARQFSNEL